jgi:hypothetical protein
MTLGCLFFLAQQQPQQHSRVQTDMADRKSWDVSQLRKYDIQLDEIPRLNVRDPKVDEFIAENVSTLRTYTNYVM